LLDLTDKIGPARLFRNRKTGERFLAAKELNDDVIYAVMDENDKPINAGNRFPKDEFIGILGTCEMEEKIDMNSGFYSTDSIFHEWC
jgi:hypothetical protein